MTRSSPVRVADPFPGRLAGNLWAPCPPMCRCAAPSASRDWDAISYDALPLPQERRGRHVLTKLPRRRDLQVLDAGARTGRDIDALFKRLPCGHVAAADS